MRYNFLTKILLIGEYRVGKSSLVLRYVEDRFPGDYQATIGANFLVKSVTIKMEDGEEFKVGLQLWDIGGHVRSSQVGKVFYQGVMGALLVYDITRPETLEKAHLWSDELLKYSPNAKIFLVGNKTDLDDQRKISKAEGQAVKEKQGYHSFYETSAKTGEVVNETFEKFAEFLVASNREKMDL